MNVHVLQHVPFEGVGSIGPWLAMQGATVGCTRFYESSVLPATTNLDLVIAMGRPMSVNDEASFPWLKSKNSSSVPGLLPISKHIDRLSLAR